MTVPVMLLAEASYSVSLRFYEAVLLFIFLLFVSLMLLMVILFGSHISAMRKAARRDRLRKNIEAAARKAVSAGSRQKAESVLPPKDELFSRRGLAALSDVLGSMDASSAKTLRGILLQMDCRTHLAEQLKSSNEDFLAEIVRLVGELNLKELDGETARIMTAAKDNINVQYEAFFALARLGSYDHIVGICMDENFVQQLSFRSLQEVIDAYTGDKPALYKRLLSSPDAYIVRACIKRAGIERIKNLALDIEAFLDNPNFNVVIDAILALGAMRHNAAAERIAGFLQNERWEVRGAAVKALASINLNAYTDSLIAALRDSEWQVRYNAGSALSRVKDISSVREKVAATKDRFAVDMLGYITEMADIRRAKK